MTSVHMMYQLALVVMFAAGVGQGRDDFCWTFRAYSCFFKNIKIMLKTKAVFAYVKFPMNKSRVRNITTFPVAHYTIVSTVLFKRVWVSDLFGIISENASWSLPLWQFLF